VLLRVSVTDSQRLIKFSLVLHPSIFSIVKDGEEGGREHRDGTA
jgi:hypothetical protein